MFSIIYMGRKVGEKGQIWVETVIYTLISLLLIGLVIAFVGPKIEEIQDRLIIEQTIGLINNLDEIILSVSEVSGNKRIISVGIKKGSLEIDGENDTISFVIESDLVYSEPGETITEGNLKIITEKLGSSNKITLTKKYSRYDITYEGGDGSKRITQSSTPYKFSIENKGIVNGKSVIDITIS